MPNSYPSICQRCGMQFISKARSAYEARLVKYCPSCRCVVISQHSRLPRKKPHRYVCEYCGKSTCTYPSRCTQRFCSAECREASKKRPVSIRCAGCGTVFQVMYARRYRRYCTHECYFNSLQLEGNPRWNGGRAHYYGPSYPAQREAARVRDNFTCQVCDLPERDSFRELDVHHIIAFKRYGLKRHVEANRLANLITLCHSCHIKIETGTAHLPQAILDRTRRE